MNVRKVQALNQQVLEAVARACHETNRAYCSEILGDSSQPPWDQAPQEMQASTRLGVMAFYNEPMSGPDLMHERWRQTKEIQGWAYGPEKSVPLKMHPCMVPFDELPAEQQLKDILFSGTCRMLFEAFGLLRYDQDDLPGLIIPFQVNGR
jgi:hypothetical protein